MCCAKVADFLSQLLAWLDKDVGLDACVHVVLQVNCIGLGDVHVHLDVILVVWILLFVGVEQMLVLLQIFDDLPVDADVLERSVDDDEHLGGDCPVVQVGDVSLKEELKCANR